MKMTALNLIGFVGVIIFCMAASPKGNGLGALLAGLAVVGVLVLATIEHNSPLG